VRLGTLNRKGGGIGGIGHNGVDHFTKKKKKQLNSVKSLCVMIQRHQAVLSIILFP